MPNVTEIQSQVVETVKKAQDLAAETVKVWTDQASKLVPEQIPNFIPQAKTAVNTAFLAAEQAVARQRELVLGILDSVETRLVKAQAGPASKTAAKPAAKATTTTTTTTSEAN